MEFSQHVVSNKGYSPPATPSAPEQKLQLDIGEQSHKPVEFGDSDLEFPESPARVDLQKFYVEKKETNIGLDTAQEEDEGDVYSSDDDEGYDEEGCIHVRTKQYHELDLP